ncbi:MAG TPA: MBL fold metallo-hydrolase [Methanomicrobia archaeon]|nr:MBL fold metallo-hydrolase [Methanomicrobia archaeon]
MQLTVLVDNNTLIDRYFLGEPAVSYFIDDAGTRILFDVGYSDAFLINAQKMAIDLCTVDFVVLSHGHLDHTWGLDPLIRLYLESKFERFESKKPTLVAHPSAFQTKLLEGVGQIGSLVTERRAANYFTLHQSREPVWLTERLVYLGEIPRRNEFEAQTPIGTVVTAEKEAEADYSLDDSALAYQSSQGLVVITACAHAGICNTIEYAREVCGEDRVADVIGGFHLLNPPERQLKRTLAYFASRQPAAVHACHCTDLHSKLALAQVAMLQEVGVGLRLCYE